MDTYEHTQEPPRLKQWERHDCQKGSVDSIQFGLTDLVLKVRAHTRAS
jgi:hypothetical protein